MKRIASLFLLVTLFYNVLGYYLMFAYQEEQAWVKTMTNEPDSNYNVIHLNASLYSFIEDTDFEYVNENITIENKSYHIFKKRIKNNILSLYYLRNKHNEVISNEAKNIIASQLFNESSKSNSPLKKMMKSFIKDYISNDYYELETKPLIATYSTRLHSNPNNVLLDGFLTIHYTPPKIA